MATIVFCHAHPDDEASQTSGLMARASAEGHRVVVVFATNGDHGEVAADAVAGETVADYRRREAEARLVHGSPTPSSRRRGCRRRRR